MMEKWLKCTVLKGMFSDELAVRYSPRSGTDYSAFVSKSTVRNQQNDQGEVRVRVFREGETPWAVLPSAEQAIIPVNDSDLVPA